MASVTREDVNQALNRGWGTFVARFNALTPAAQADFLQQQGYARLGDLLAHAAAWFDEGRQAIEILRQNRDWQSPQYDVDAFNAKAVQDAAGLDEAALIQHFETHRARLAELVASLSDDDFQFKRINRRLEIEVIGHLEEHALPTPT